MLTTYGTFDSILPQRYFGSIIKSKGTRASNSIITGETLFYTVKQGDTLESIAGQHNVTTSDIRSHNRLVFPTGEPGTIYASLVLTIPTCRQQEVEDVDDASSQQRGFANEERFRRVYLVRRGDTLSDICSRFGVDVGDLRRNNREYFPAGEQRDVEAGQRLIIHVTRQHMDCTEVPSAIADGVRGQDNTNQRPLPWTSLLYTKEIKELTGHIFEMRSHY